MPKFQKILLVGLFSAFSFYSLSQASSNEQGDLASSVKPIFHPGIPSVEERPTNGCFPRFKETLTSCLRRTKKAGSAVVPVLEFALPFIQDDHLRNTLNSAIKIAQSTTNSIQFNEDGSLKLPDGTQLQNAVFLVFSDNSKFFTEESKMFIPLVVSQLPTSDYRLKMRLIGFIALVDNPTTSYLLSFEDKTGEVGLMNEGTTLATQSFSLFDPSIESSARQKLGAYFSEYITASQARTQAERHTQGQRTPQSFLDPKGGILTAYKALVAQNPAYQFAHLSKEILNEHTNI